MVHQRSGDPPHGGPLNGAQRNLLTLSSSHCDPEQTRRFAAGRPSTGVTAWPLQPAPHLNVSGDVVSRRGLGISSLP
jgi:hypothetical protein